MRGKMSKTRALGLGCLVLAALSGCYGADTGDEEGAPYSAMLVSDLTVGGYRCPSSGEIAGRTRPADNMYYLTTFGGGSDNQRMACFGYADGRWMYIADAALRCRSRVKLTNPRTGRWCVVQVADVGPNICVERAAGKPIIDASPAISRELYGIGSAGWSDRGAHPRRARVFDRAAHRLRRRLDDARHASPGQNGGRTCYSTTWGRDMSLGACVQSRSDRIYYQCTNLGWVTSGGITASRTGPGGPDHVPPAELLSARQRRRAMSTPSRIGTAATS